MDIRRLQVTGGASYMVTLPKKWVQSNKLSKNDSVELIQQRDGTLTIAPKNLGEKTSKPKEILVTPADTQTTLFRTLIGAYVMGYTQIHVSSPQRMGTDLREAATRFTQTAVGPEVVEETDKSITIKDLMDPKQMPFSATIDRMHVLVKTMHEDAIMALENRDEDLTKDIIARDEDVDRLKWLIAHQYHILTTKPNLAKDMNVSQNEMHTCYLAGSILERIDDHAVIIAENVPHLFGCADTKLMSEIKTASQKSLQLLDCAMNSWKNKDLRKANETIDSMDALAPLCDCIPLMENLPEPRQVSALHYVFEGIRRTGEYSTNIAELVINHIVDEL